MTNSAYHLVEFRRFGYFCSLAFVAIWLGLFELGQDGDSLNTADFHDFYEDFGEYETFRNQSISKPYQSITCALWYKILYYSISKQELATHTIK